MNLLAQNIIVLLESMWFLSFLPAAKGLFLKNNLKYLNTATANYLNEERGGGSCRLLLGLITCAIFLK